MNKKIHNPKSNAPAVYIPCWLLQVPVQLLSSNAKILYGRLCQWSSEDGIVFRSAPQLAEEIGTNARQVERHLKELRDAELIGTFQPQAGGLNHFEFYDHEWMYLPINKHLAYKIPPPVTPVHPPSNMSVPPVKNVGTPPSDLSVINKKEIRINTTTTSAQILNTNFDLEPVVVSLLSPKPKTPTPTQKAGDFIEMQLLAIYRSHPFVTPDGIYGEEDFVSAALFSIDNRGEQSIDSRVRGIRKLVESGRYTGEAEWILKNNNRRNSSIGDANVELQLKASSQKAVILTKAKGKEENLREIMSKISKNKEETTVKPVYAHLIPIAQLPRKPYKSITLPAKNNEELLFQPDMSLVEAARKASERVIDEWEVRL